MSALDLEGALALAQRLGDEVGAYLLEGFRTDARVSLKGAVDLVTQYDLEAERRVRSAIEEAFPDHEIVGEEESGAGVARPEGPTWYVDPIDGTTNFAHGHPFFCLSLGLYEGEMPRLGLVAAPALGVTWWGIPGRAAFRGEVACAVSSRPTLREALVATGFAYNARDLDANVSGELRRMLAASRGLRRCGSAALDLCLVADGTYDFYWERGLAPWDMAGGAAIVLAAGGRLSAMDGGAGRPLEGSLAASNGLVHEAALSTLSGDADG